MEFYIIKNMLAKWQRNGISNVIVLIVIFIYLFFDDLVIYEF